MSRWLPLLHVWLPVLCLALAPARAAALDWVVVPYGLSDLSAATRTADRLVRALAERRIAVASPHEARDVFLDRSRAPAPLDPQGAKLLADVRKRALDHAAYGRRDAARRAAEEAMRAAEAAPEALLGDTDVARHVLDACLAVVRVDLQEHDRALAVQDAQRCRRIVPDLAPRESTHSAEVVGALAEAENELRRAGAAPVTITSAAVEPCSVFLQGRRLGTTPFRYEHAPLGPTTVYLECGAQRSRVHLLQLGDAEQTLSIDPASDARISDRDVISVAYTSEAQLAEHALADTRNVAQTLGARSVVMVRELAQGALEAVRFDASRGQPVASVQIRAGQLGETAAVQQAAEALALQRQDVPMPPAFRPRAPAAAAIAAPVASLPATSSAPPRADHAPEPSRRVRRTFTWAFGALTAAAGATSLGLGLAVQSKVADQEACEDEARGDVCLDIRDQGNRYLAAAYVMAGVAGGAALATLTAFVLEGRAHQPVQTSLGIGPTGVSLAASF